jgi:MFS family permease
VRLFLAFRLLFTSRFYYPVFTILFLDYGLTLEQFSLLNVLWAATIVIAEVPSGALADIVGRRRLVVAAAFLMLIELATIGFVPLGNPDLILAAFVINRICSGLAEAAASGADEALAYDSIVEAGHEDQWPQVLEALGKLTSIGMFAAMITGALVYDREVMGTILGALGVGELGPKDLIRVPVIMTFCTGCFAFLAAWRLKEVGETPERPNLGSIRVAFSQVWGTGRWIVKCAPFVLVVILAGLALDSVARQFALLASEYFRQISIPTVLLGPISAGAALLGIVSAKVSRVMAERCRPWVNFAILTCFLCGGLFGVGLGIPYWGVLFALVPFLTLSSIGFLQSHYLNKAVDSSRRATALSFKGLALNVGMGLASVLYAWLLRHLEAGGLSKEATFFPGLRWFAPYAAVLALLVFLAGAWLLKGQAGCPDAESEAKEPPSDPEPEEPSSEPEPEAKEPPSDPESEA